MSETQTVKEGTEDEAVIIPDVPFLTGVGGGTWHAISQESMAYLRRSDADSVAFAECGELVRVAAKFGAYNRTTVPVIYHPCQVCAWTVAMAAGTLDAEAELSVPPERELPGLAAVLPDPVIAANTLRALIARAREHPDEDGALVQLLAAAAAHAPVQLMSEECAEEDCTHEGGCPGPAACPACSLRAGDWAGEWAGYFREECTIPAPCSVLLALAKHAGITS